MHDSLKGVVDLNLGWVRAFIFHQELTLMYWLIDMYPRKNKPSSDQNIVVFENGNYSKELVQG